MNNVELFVYINNNGINLFEEKVDYFKSSDLSPRIYKRLFDVKTFDNTIGDYTLNLKIPRTNNNNKIFNYIGDTQSRDNFFNFQSYRARIVVNSVDVLVGTLTIDIINPDNFECIIIGDNISWANLIGDKTLRDITTLPSFPYSGLRGTNFIPWPENDPNTVDIQSVWGTDEKGNYKLQFPLVSYGNFNAPESKSDVYQFNLSNGSDVIEVLNNSTSKILIGYFVVCSGIPNHSRVVAIIDDTHFSIGVPATDNGSKFGRINSTDLNPINDEFTISDSKWTSGLDYGRLIWRPQEWCWDALEFNPAGYFKTIFTNIFKTFGYEVAGTFISDTNLDNLILPFVDSANNSPNLNWGLLSKAKIFNNGYTFTRGAGSGKFGSGAFPIADYPGVDWSGSNRVGFNGNGATIYHDVDVIGYTNQDTLNYDYEFNYYRQQASYKAPIDGTYNINFSVYLGSFLKHYLYLNATTSGQPPAPIGNHQFRLVIWKDTQPFNPSIFNSGDINDILVNGNSSFSQKVFISPNFLGVDAPVHITPTIGGLHKPSGQLNAWYEITWNLGYIYDVNKDIEMKKGEFLTYFWICDLDNTPDWLTPNGGKSDDTFINILFHTLTIGNLRIPDINGTNKLVTAPYNLSVAKVLPDIKMSDYILSITKLFNLFYYVDQETKKIYFNYIDDYFFLPITALNWTNKCDIRESILKPLTGYKTIYFNFAEQTDEELGIELNYNYIYKSDSKYYTDTLTIDNIFSVTFDREYYYLTNGTSAEYKKIIVPTLDTKDELSKTLSDSGQKLDYNPRILLWEGLHYINFNPHWIGNPNDINNQYQIPTLPKASNLPWLRYSDIPNTVILAPNESRLGLFKKYYADQVAQNEKSIEIRIPIMLTETDLSELDFRRPIIINDQLFILSSIEGFDPVVPKPTDVILYKK